MSGEPANYHLNSKAAEELERQTDLAENLLERLAAHLAAIAPKQPSTTSDLVEAKHVQAAADLLFGSVTFPNDSRDVFISFSHEDSAFVNELSAELTRRDLTHFKSDRDIQLASDWANSVWNAIRNCRLFISILTPRFMTSPWRDLEGGAACASGKQLLSVLRYVDPKELKPPFDRWQCIVVESTDQLTRLVDAIQTLLAEPDVD